MTEAEIVAALRTIRYSSPAARKRRHQPALKTIADRAAIDRITLYRAIRSGALSARHTGPLSEAIQSVTREACQNLRSHRLAAGD